MQIEKIYQVPGEWTISSYYTLLPTAPDGSGRITLAACNLQSKICSVYIFDADGNITDNFGHRPAESMFYHTGSWESWSPDGRYVYYQSGSLAAPSVSRYDTVKKCSETITGVDLEGAPPSGEPILGGLPGMLYGAGYGYGVYNPALCPVPFEERDRHGIFEFGFDGRAPQLIYSINDFLKFHPKRDELLALDEELKNKYSRVCGLSLMAYCVRFSPNGEHFLVYFGNHCVVKERNEPRISHIFTGRRGDKTLKFALDVSGRGVHYSALDNGDILGFYRPDGEEKTSIYIYSPATGKLEKICSPEHGGGHPSVSPVHPRLCVNDEHGKNSVTIWERGTGRVLDTIYLKATGPDCKPCGVPVRDHTRCCHHPRFTADGKYILSNFIDDNGLCAVAKIKIPEDLLK